MNPFKSDIENNAFLSEEDKQEMIRIRDKRPLKPEEGKMIVDFINDCVWDGTKKAVCSRDISKPCTLLCPLITFHDSDEDDEERYVCFRCGCENVCYDIDGVIE